MVDYRGNRVEIEGSFRLGQGFVRLPKSAKIDGVPMMMSGGRSGIQRESSLKMLLGSRPIPIVRKADPSERNLGLGEVVVELERLQGRGLRFRPHLPRRKHTPEPEHFVAISQPGVSQRVSRVFLDSLLKVFNGFRK